jgi:hypothetical protein
MEEDITEEVFYLVDILRGIESRIGRECEIEDTPQVTIYWSGGFEVRDLDIKIRCKRENEDEDVILVETIGKIYVSGGEVEDVELYPVEEVVEKLYSKYKALYT